MSLYKKLMREVPVTIGSFVSPSSDDEDTGCTDKNQQNYDEKRLNKFTIFTPLTPTQSI